MEFSLFFLSKNSDSYLYFLYVLLFINFRDLSSNQLNETIPSDMFSRNITTM